MYRIPGVPFNGPPWKSAMVFGTDLASFHGLRSPFPSFVILPPGVTVLDMSPSLAQAEFGFISGMNSCPSSFWRPAYSQQDSLPHAFQTCLPFRSPVPCGLHSLWDGWGESFLKIVDFNSSFNMLSLDPYKIYKALSYLTSDCLNSVLWSISGFYIWPSSLTHSSVSGHAFRFAVWWLILINHSIGLRVTKEEGFP